MRSLDERKKKLVADIIRQLHQGLPVEKAKDRILKEVGRLSSAEITGIEQSLIDEGLPPEEIKRFCNVHALLFEHALEQSVATPDQPAHPVNALIRENRRIEEITARLKKAMSAGDAAGARAALTELRGLDRHYAIKENAIFPFLERHGFTGPSKVMWSKHDEIRALLKKAEAGSANGMPDPGALSALVAEVDGMVFKEEKILFPAALERIEPSEWVQVLKGAEEIGYPYAGTVRTAPAAGRGGGSGTRDGRIGGGDFRGQARDGRAPQRDPHRGAAHGYAGCASGGHLVCRCGGQSPLFLPVQGPDLRPRHIGPG